MEYVIITIPAVPILELKEMANHDTVGLFITSNEVKLTSDPTSEYRKLIEAMVQCGKSYSVEHELFRDSRTSDVIFEIHVFDKDDHPLHTIKCVRARY